ncbi:hypothetical protein KEM56_007249 [Ascosphaera pollenicola]|nr:hypothetical protein KEM56_007249 [Ascosphaera pollenicola]
MSRGTASSAEQLNELRRSLTRQRSNMSEFDLGEYSNEKGDHICELITLACSHPLFKYLKQQRRIDELHYTDEDRKFMYDEAPEVYGCAGPPLKPLKGKGLWSVRRLENLDTKGLVGGVLDAFAGLLSFYDGTEGMEDHRHPVDPTDPGEAGSDSDRQSDESKKNLRRFAVACQIRIEEHKVCLFVSTADDAPIPDEVGVYLQRIWSLLRDLSHSNLQDEFWHDSDVSEKGNEDGDKQDGNETENDNERMIPEVPSDQPSPFDCPPLVALLNYTMLNSYAHWHPRFVKHFAHVHSARRISPQLFRVFERIPDGDGAQVQLIWGSFISEAESLNAAFQMYGRDYVRSPEFRERMFETIVCLENVVQGQGTVADMLIYEDERRGKEQEVQEAKGSGSRFKKVFAQEKKKKDDHAAEMSDPKGKGKAVAQGDEGEELVVDPEVEAIRKEPPSICRCSLPKCMRKLISPFDHITALIDFATLSERRNLLENDLEVIPVHVSTEDEREDEREEQDQAQAEVDEQIDGPDTKHQVKVSDYHDNSQTIRQTLTVFRTRSKSKSSPITVPASRVPPTRHELQSLMISSFFSNIMSRYEPRSTRQKIADLAAELEPPSLLPPRHIHPEVKLLYHLTSSHIPTARHIGVSSPACIPCTVLFTTWNEMNGQSFHISGVSIVNNTNDSQESLDLDKKTPFGGKKTELGNGKYSPSWTLPREWRGTELVKRTQEELQSRIGEALLREVDYRRMIQGDDGWWEAGEDGQPEPDTSFTAQSANVKSPPATHQDSKTRLSVSKSSETTKPKQGKNKLNLSKKMKKAKWSFMDPTTACESQ